MTETDLTAFPIESPEDLAVFADYLEEQRHPKACVVRWMVVNGKWPKWFDLKDWSDWAVSNNWGWFRADLHGARYWVAESDDLPAGSFTPRGTYEGSGWEIFDTLGECIHYAISHWNGKPLSEGKVWRT